MSDTTYLLVAYENGKPKHPGNAMRKTISKGEFHLLMQDFQVDVELNDQPYSIEEKRSLSITIGGCQHLLLIIDIKRKA